MALIVFLLPWAMVAGQTGSPKPTQVRSYNPTGERQVIAADEARRIAMLRADVRALDTLLAEDVTVFWGDGTVDNKASTIALFREHRLEYSRLDYDSTRVRMYGQTAVVTGRAHIELRSDGRPVVHAARVTRVWVRNNRRWRLVVMQTTRADATP